MTKHYSFPAALALIAPSPHTRDFSADQHGGGGILAALRECAAKPGSVAKFEVADHPAYGSKVYATVAVGFEQNGPDGKPSWRHAGEEDDLAGCGSHALIATWYADQSVEAAAAKLAYQLGIQAGRAGPNATVFRVQP